MDNDKDVDVKEEVKDVELPDEIVWEDWAQTVDYQLGRLYSHNAIVEDQLKWIDNFKFFLELVAYALIGALIGWLIGEFLVMLGAPFSKGSK